LSETNEDIAPKHIQAQVDRIVLCLFGNGKTGLTTRVTVLEVATTKHCRNWTRLIEMIQRDIVIVGIMWLLLKP